MEGSISSHRGHNIYKSIDIHSKTRNIGALLHSHSRKDLLADQHAKHLSIEVSEVVFVSQHARRLGINITGMKIIITKVLCANQFAWHLSIKNSRGDMCKSMCKTLKITKVICANQFAMHLSIKITEVIFVSQCARL